MHELSIAGYIVDVATRHAEGRRVTKVYLKLGHLRQVVPSALSFGFELVAMGTTVEGAGLEIEKIPAAGLCCACASETRLDNFPLRCGACGGFELQIIAGEELYVESLEMEEQGVKGGP
ncbi:MAG: hypothetical protein AVDCRST_MAG25-89 [uncultured Rubrobacteraceae bacterium]|uniref:Hydrogenase maturation factor HypA n=1 Tax=uncultured Rubrobacteraceae bacterium TaxID=349277 RepID=A0A6J4QWN5_9ACTN|nr:MAG: hypothetical protein AVDCRST_MAG25-89 [uncultured Rubrobacteraceae bacterium]